MNEPMQFINHFHNISKSQNIDEVFTCGCCYWFARILCERFQGAKLMYDQLENHFVAKINGRLYDITGDVTEQYIVFAWEDFEDDLERERIEKYCIKFIE